MERREIFTVLCNSQNVDSAKLDLEKLAQLSDGFTGADINATIIQARLAAYENAVAIAIVSTFVYYLCIICLTRT